MTGSSARMRVRPRLTLHGTGRRLGLPSGGRRYPAVVM